MRWSSAASTAPRLDAAVREATDAVRAGLDGATPDLAVAFVSPHHAGAWEGLPGLVAETLDASVLVGCSAGGVIGGGHEHEETPAVSLTAATLPGVTVTPFHLDDASSALGVADPAAHLIVLPDPFTFAIDAFLPRIAEEHPGGVVVGGLASGGREAGGNGLFLDGAAHRTGAVGVALTGDVAVDTIVAQGCRPIGEPMFVTRAERNVLHELDGTRADIVLQDLFRRSSAEDRELFRHSLFLGIVMTEGRHEYRQGDFLVRNVLGLDGRAGSLIVGALVHEGMVVQFHLRDARTSADDLVALLARYHGTPAGALLFSCLGRGKGLYGHPDHDTAAFQARCGDVPLGGFFCNGEIGPVQGRTFLHGYTSAFALFRPRG